MNIPEVVAVVFLGLVLGSFATALVYRVPRKQNWVSKRSACTACKTILTPIDLLPVLSWIFCRGRCRHCGAGVSWIYPVIELCVLGASLLIYSVFGFSGEGAFLFAALPFLVALTVVDFQRMLLPNQLVFICFAIGVARLVYFSLSGYFVAAAEIFIPYVFGAIVYAFIAMALRHSISFALRKEALGIGDVKFFSVAGLWLGLYMLPLFFIITGVVGVIMAVFWRMVVRQRQFPFGPALIAALFVLLVLQGPILK